MEYEPLPFWKVASRHRLYIQLQRERCSRQTLPGSNCLCWFLSLQSRSIKKVFRSDPNALASCFDGSKDLQEEILFIEEILKRRTLNPIKAEIFSISTGAYHDRKSTSACQPSHKILARNNSANYHTKSYKRIQKVAEKNQQLRTFQLQNWGMSWKCLQGPCCCSIVDDQSTNGVQVRVSGTFDLFFSAVKMGGFSYPRGLKGLNLEHRRIFFPL